MTRVYTFLRQNDACLFKQGYIFSHGRSITL